MGADCYIEPHHTRTIMKTPMPSWVRIVREPEAAYKAHTAGPIVRDASAVHAYLAPRLASEEREKFMILMLNGRNRLLGLHDVSTGTATTCLVHPREVFRAAIAIGAAAVILAHNHPSGDADPSCEDEALTERMVKAGEILGIRLLDHVVVTHGSYYSLAEHSKGGL